MNRGDKKINHVVQNLEVEDHPFAISTPGEKTKKVQIQFWKSALKQQECRYAIFLTVDRNDRLSRPTMSRCI